MATTPPPAPTPAPPKAPAFNPTADDVKLWNKQSFDYLADGVKQLITIAAGVVTATAIFLKDLTSTYARAATIVAWIPLFISAIFGTLALMALAGNSRRAALGHIATPTLEDEILDQQQKQFLFFFVGIFLILVSGVLAAFSTPKSTDIPKIVNFFSEPAPTPAPPAHVEQQPPVKAPTAVQTPAKPKRRVRKVRPQVCQCDRGLPSPSGSFISAPHGQQR